MYVYIYISRYLHKVTYGTALWALWWCPRNGALVGPGRCSLKMTIPKSRDYVASSVETDQEIDVFIQRIHGPWLSNLLSTQFVIQRSKSTRICHA